MSVALLIAALLVFNAGWVMGSWWATRKNSYDEGYVQAMCDMADDDAIARSLANRQATHVEVQRSRAVWQ